MIRNEDKFSLTGVSAVHITTLFALAISHPIYDLLTKKDHATFFIAHQSQAIDIYLLVILLSVLLPLTIFGVLWLTNLLFTKFARGLYAAVLLSLFALLFLQAAKMLLGDFEILSIGVAIAASVIATVGFITTSWVKTFVSLLSIAVIASPFLFLTNASMKSFLIRKEAQDYRLFSSDKKLPNVVMIIFDELPLTSLLDENRLIDDVRYPNFAKLAKSSDWYRNTTTTHYSTGGGALASILTGWYPSNYRKNIPKENRKVKGSLDRRKMPQNLFSMLEKTHQVFAIEPMTKLAAENQTIKISIPPFKERFLSLSCDTFFVYSHLISPTIWKTKLPPIHGQWADFCSPKEKNASAFVEWPYSGKKPGAVKRLIETLSDTPEPKFYFLHSLLPHFPFLYNENGQRHANKLKFMTQDFRIPTGHNNWPNETIANLGYQAHLIQLKFTDQLLGRVLDQLERFDLFDQSLIVLTADHGTSFYWDSTGLSDEKISEIQASDTMYVPLFIKMPFQSQGNINDMQVETIDIVPTIADILQVDIPWKADGVSVFEEKRPTRNRIGLFPQKIEYGKNIEPDFLSLKRKVELFGTGDMKELFSIGPQHEIVGKPTSSFLSQNSKETVSILESVKYSRYKPNEFNTRAYVEGEISNKLRKVDPEKLKIAVAINGIIVSTTTATTATISLLMPREKLEKDGKVHFLARIPTNSWQNGNDEITVHEIVQGAPGSPVSLINFAEQP
jgi:hypothetical protein